MEGRKTMTKQQKIARLNKSIKLQERTRENLEQMVIDSGATVALCDKIIANLEAQKRNLEMGA